MLGLYGKKDIKADPKFFGFRRYEKEKGGLISPPNSPMLISHISSCGIFA